MFVVRDNSLSLPFILLLEKNWKFVWQICAERASKYYLTLVRTEMVHTLKYMKGLNLFPQYYTMTSENLVF